MFQGAEPYSFAQMGWGGMWYLTWSNNDGVYVSSRFLVYAEESYLQWDYNLDAKS